MTDPTLKSRPQARLRNGQKRLHCRAGLRHLARFRRDEDGAIVLFTLFALFMMLIAGGVAMDIMRQEMMRARIQNTLDSAALAGAGAPYGTSAKAIVEDYMAKAGMADYLNAIDDDGEGDDDDVVQTQNASSVSASAHSTVDTYLMHLSGVKKLGASAASKAERRVPKLEVAMVLDVSGSMGNPSYSDGDEDTDPRDLPSKLDNLQIAGKKFVTTILDSADPGNAVISIVPFSWDVSPGKSIMGALNVDERHDYSTCLEFKASDYNSTAIDPDVEQTQLIYTSEYDNGFDRLNTEFRTCYNESSAEILAYSVSETALHNKIDALVDAGNTSGDVGMKWGAALLDPKFQSVKTALNGITVDGAKLVSDLVGTVPAEYDEGETLKVIVMMGDGENTYSNRFAADSDYRGENSYLYYLEFAQKQFKYAYRRYRSGYRWSYDPNVCGDRKWTCVYDNLSGDSYYIYNPLQNEYRSLGGGDTLTAEQFANIQNSEDGFEQKIQYSWEKAWGRISPDYLHRYFSYGSAEREFEGDEREDWWVNKVRPVTGSEKNTRMSNVCKAAKKKGVVVYTIGFEVDKGGTAETELKSCATSHAHYYRANGINITDAFSSIASNVVNLRLTQ